MKLETVSKILDDLPIGRSEFEFKNFFIDAYPSSARLHAAALLELENLHISKIDLDDKLANSALSAAEQLRAHRQLAIIQNQIDQLSKFFTSVDFTDLANKDLYEKQESEYWINALGKQAAVELLTTERVSTATMNQMINLSPNDFLASVRICVDSVKLIKNTTDGLNSK